VPAGVAAFLVIGFVGDLLRGSRAAFFPLSAPCAACALLLVLPGAREPALAQRGVRELPAHPRDGEPLALFGVGGRTSAYYAGGEPKTFNDAAKRLRVAHRRPRQRRRFLVMKTDELAKLNQMYREKSNPRENLPVLDGRSSQISSWRRVWRRARRAKIH